MHKEELFLPINELVTRVSNKVSGKKNPDIPYVGLEHIAPNEPFLITTAPSDSSISVNSIFKKGDILFGKLRPNLGKSLPALFDGYCSTDILVLRTRPGISPEFAAKVLQSEAVFRAVVRTSEGTKMPRTSWNKLKILPVFVPQPLEQHILARILYILDTHIQQTEQLIAKLKQIMLGLLHDLLTRGIDENGEMRDPVAHPENFKESTVGSIPREWNVGKFEALANIIDPQPSHRAPAEVIDGEPYIGVGDLRADGSINFESCRKVSYKAVIEQQQRFSIEVGDIIFGKIGTIGFPQFLPQDIRYALNANTVLIKPIYCPSYILWLLRSSFVEKQIQMQIHSTTQPAFGIRRIRAMLVPLPSKNEQHRISIVLDSHNAHISAEVADLAKLKKIKKGLMNDLLTGRVRVTQLIAECEQLSI